MIICNANPQDMTAVLEIYNEAVLTLTCTADHEPQTIEQRLHWYETRMQGGFPVLLAKENDEVIGWASYGPFHTRYGYRFTVENSVYVAKAWRGRGAGSALMQPLLQHARQNGFHSMMALIDSQNQASIRLHTAFGFQQAACYKEVVYKFDRWLDVVVMQHLFT